MTETPRPNRGGGRARVARMIVRVALAVAVIAPLLAGAAVIGRILEVMPLQTAYRVLLDWAPAAASVGVLGGVPALLVSFFARPRWWIALGAAALLLPLTVLVATAGLKAQRTVNPPVHEVATDWSEPLVFSERVLALRGPGSAPVQANPSLEQPWGPSGGAIRENWGAQRVSDLNRLTCPAARPVPRMVRQDVVQRVLEEQGLILVGAAPWRVEGTARSPWLHVYSDVAVRMRPERTDVRVTGREPGGDLGESCRLAVRLLRALDEASR